MRATCRDCGNEWTLQKDLEAYADGPRCPDCGSRDVEADEPDESEPTAARAFAALEDGAELTELVTEHGIDPSHVDELADQFDRLSEYQVIAEAELEQRLEAAREEAREKVQDRFDRDRGELVNQINLWKQEALTQQERVRALDKQLDVEFRKGWEVCGEYFEDDVVPEVREEASSEAFEQAREEYEAELAELREEVEAEADAVEERVDELRDELIRERRANEHLAELVRVLKSGEVGEVFAAGFESGMIEGVDEGFGEGRAEGMLETARALT